MRVKAVGSKIIARVERPKEVVRNGITLLADANPTAVVVSVGEMVPKTISVGSVIIHHQYSGELFHVDDQEYVGLNYSDIMCEVRESSIEVDNAIITL